MKKLLLLSFFAINQLMAQSFQFNDIEPETAQKWGRENGRNIFVLIENKLNLNSLKIEKEILLEQEVKDILYHKFICIKLDSESEIGSNFIKKYGLNEETLFVFMGTDDDILIKESRKISVDEFIELTERAIELAKESDPTKFYESEFKNGRKDVEFLEKYLNFLIDKQMNCTEVITQYFKSIPEEDYVKNKNLQYLVSSNYDGHINSFMYEIVVKLKDLETTFKNKLIEKYKSLIYQTVSYSAELKDEKLFLKADSIAKTWEIPETQKYEYFYRKCFFYGATKDTSKLRNYLLDFIQNEVWEFSTNELNNIKIIKIEDKDLLSKVIVRQFKIGNQKEYFSRVHSTKMNRILATDILNEASLTVLKAFRNDKFMLQKGLEWAERADKIKLYHDNSGIVTYSKLLYLNGYREKAITKLGFILDDLSTTKINNEFSKKWQEYVDKLMIKMIKNEDIE